MSTHSYISCNIFSCDFIKLSSSHQLTPLIQIKSLFKLAPSAIYFYFVFMPFCPCTLCLPYFKAKLGFSLLCYSPSFFSFSPSFFLSPPCCSNHQQHPSPSLNHMSLSYFFSLFLMSIIPKLDFLNCLLKNISYSFCHVF